MTLSLEDLIPNGLFKVDPKITGKTDKGTVYVQCSSYINLILSLDNVEEEVKTIINTLENGTFYLPKVQQEYERYKECTTKDKRPLCILAVF